MSIKQWFSLFRIDDWLHVLGIPLLGLVYASEKVFSFRLILLSIVVSSLYLAHGYAINEVFDTLDPDDRPRRDAVLKDRPRFTHALLVAFIPFLFNLLFASLLSVQTVTIVIIGMLLSYLYSGYPMRLKKIPVIELFCNAAGFCLLFLIGYSAVRPLTLDAIEIGILFLILFIPLQLIHELAHFENDKEHKVYTTVAKYGIKKSVYFIICSLPLLAIWSICICLQAKLPFYLFLLSTIYSIALIIKVYSCFRDINLSLTRNKLRIYARYLTVLYGAGIMFILLKYV